jgi:hypothetical protein
MSSKHPLQENPVGPATISSSIPSAGVLPVGTTSAQVEEPWLSPQQSVLMSLYEEEFTWLFATLSARSGNQR